MQTHNVILTFYILALENSAAAHHKIDIKGGGVMVYSAGGGTLPLECQCGSDALMTVMLCDGSAAAVISLN